MPTASKGGVVIESLAKHIAREKEKRAKSAEMDLLRRQQQKEDIKMMMDLGFQPEGEVTPEMLFGGQPPQARTKGFGGFEDTLYGGPEASSYKEPTVGEALKWKAKPKKFEPTTLEEVSALEQAKRALSPEEKQTRERGEIIQAITDLLKEGGLKDFESPDVPGYIDETLFGGKQGVPKGSERELGRFVPDIVDPRTGFGYTRKKEAFVPPTDMSLTDITVGEKGKPVRKYELPKEKKATDEEYQKDLENYNAITDPAQKIIQRQIIKRKYGQDPEMAIEKEKQPSWAQEQKVASIREGLKRGRIIIGKEFGEPDTYKFEDDKDSTAYEKALDAIALSGLDSNLFTAELEKYKPKVGGIITKGKRKFKITGFDADGMPLVEPVK